MKILFHLGHPAHFHLFKNTITGLSNHGHKITILIKKKDVLEDLLKASGLEYKNILPHGRKDNKVSIAIGQLKQDSKLLSYCIRNRQNLLVGTSVAISHVGKVLCIPSINVNEDDADVVPLYAKLAYPWATEILSPGVCRMGKWEKKTTHYNSYHELAYLHPQHFTANQLIAKKYVDINKRYFIIRFAKLGAHHDEGIKGISNELSVKLVNILSPHGNVYITSERQLSEELEQYRIQINPIDMHHVMAFASLYIGDSQTMAAEAGVLGVPFVRYNGFVGRIGYLDEIENKYQLGYGIKPEYPDELLKKVEELVQNKNTISHFKAKRSLMLEEKINYSEFLIWFIEQYPESKKKMDMNPDLQNKFK